MKQTHVVSYLEDARSDLQSHTQVVIHDGKRRCETDCEVLQDFLVERLVGKGDFLPYAPGDCRHGTHCEVLSHVKLH